MRKYLSLLCILILLISCKPTKQKELVIFHAGSLSVPFKILKDSFEAKHPEINLTLESSGSVTAIRKVTELKRACDLIAVADARLIDSFLIPKYTQQKIIFSHNEMVLAYRQNAPGSELINADNWTEILANKQIKIGRAEPNNDPCGYRTLLTLQLENIRKSKPYDPEMLSGKNIQIRPKASDLVALLQTKHLDYAFLYKTVASQFKLNYIELNDSVNFSDSNLNPFYRKAKIKINGQKPGTHSTIFGSSIEYGICVLNNSPKPSLAKEFINFLLSENAQNILFLSKH